MIIPTAWGHLVDHDEATVRDAQQRMRGYLEHLARPGYKKAIHAIGNVRDLWSGADGSRQQAGVRVLPTEEAVRTVAVYARDPRPEVRRAALSALCDAGHAALAAAPELAAALEDLDPVVRLQAVRVFAIRRPLDTVLPEGSSPNKVDPTAELIPVLRRVLADPVLAVRWGAIEALWTVHPRAELAPVLAASEPTEEGKRAQWEQLVRLLELAS